MTFSPHTVQNSLAEISKYNFSGHETFPLRYTWLSKGITNLQEYPDLFRRQDAMVILGVGKNMVRSIRYWCETLDLIESQGRGNHKTTALGENLFSTKGWDPYLENPGTLWLLHWQLASRYDRSSTWYLAFSRWGAPHFSKDQLRDWIFNQVKDVNCVRVTANSLKRDIDVFIRTYTPAKVQKAKYLEDSFDCPLVDLGLIREIDKNIYSFVKGPKLSLPQEIFIYALDEYWAKHSANQNSITLESIMYRPGSVGRVFCLSENAMYDRLTNLPEWTGMHYANTAGMRAIYRTPETNSRDVLATYYNNTMQAEPK